MTGKVSFDEFGDTTNKQLTVYAVKDGAWAVEKSGTFAGFDPYQPVVQPNHPRGGATSAPARAHIPHPRGQRTTEAQRCTIYRNSWPTA